MAWLKVDDGMWRNRKLLPVPPVGKAVYTWCMGYSSDQLTDGRLTASDMRQIAAAVGIDDWQTPMQWLIDAGLMERDGDDFVIHDYLEYNPTREQVLATRQARAESGSIGGKQKAKQNASKVPSKVPSKTLAKVCPVPVPVPVPLNDDDDKASAPEMDKEFGAIWSLYVSEFLVNPASVVHQEIVADLVKMSRDPTIHREAIKRARKGSDSNRPSLRYIEAILESYLNTGSWEKPGGNGHGTTAGNRAGNNRRSSPTDDEWEALAKEFNGKPAPVSAV